MRNITVKHKIYSRRLFLITWFKTFLAFIILLRLSFLQLFKHKKFKTQSDSNRIKSFVIPPLRGEIYDRNGKSLATNTSYFRILFNPERKSNLSNSLKLISQILNIPESELYYNRKRFRRKSSDGYILLHENLSWQDVAKLEVHSNKLPGIYIETAQRRYYPYGEESAQLLGYVASVNESELKSANNALLSHPDFKIGKNGIEKTYENHLRGLAGLKYIEVDAHGFTVNNLELSSSKIATEGKTLELSIDIELQEYANSLIKDKRASVSLIDISNGDILALCSSPAYNPNEFVLGVEDVRWQELLQDPGKPLLNKTVATTYPPGSTFKTIVALAALENDYNPEQIHECKGKIRLGRRFFHCWKKEGHGKLNLIEAIKKSCNIYFYQLSREVGIKNIVDTARKFGLGETIDIPLAGQKSGFLPTKEWKKKRLKESWVIGDTYNSSIGQGFVQVTNLQLATMVARLASKGKEVSPRIVKDDKVPEFKDIDIDKKNIEFVLNGMFKVVNEKYGTAFWSRIKTKKYKMAGKTGTAQVVSIDHTKDKDIEDIELEKRNHGLFIGFAPYDKPRYAISIIVEHGGSGSVAAAPIAKKLLYRTQKKYDLKS